MTDRDTRRTERPTASELDAGKIRQRARSIGLIATLAEEGLTESDRIAQRCLARVIKVLRDEERALDVVAAGVEART